MIAMEASRNGIVALIPLDTESPPAHGYAAFDERPYRSEDSARNKIAHVVSDRNRGGEPTNARRRFRDHAVTCRASAAAGRTPMSDFIRLVLSNFTVTFLVIGLIASAIALARAPKPLTAPVIVEALFAYFVLFSIGCSFCYNFIMHTFFGAMTARFIGWADSPFQTELGLASLGFAVVGFLAFRGGFDLRLAAVTGPALFTLGAAGVHIHDMIAAGNFAPGNAGTVFYTDILVPIVGFVLLWFQHGYPQATK